MFSALELCPLHIEYIVEAFVVSFRRSGGALRSPLVCLLVSTYIRFNIGICRLTLVFLNQML